MKVICFPLYPSSSSSPFSPPPLLHLFLSSSHPLVPLRGKQGEGPVLLCQCEGRVGGIGVVEKRVEVGAKMELGRSVECWQHNGTSISMNILPAYVTSCLDPPLSIYESYHFLYHCLSNYLLIFQSNDSSVYLLINLSYLALVISSIVLIKVCSQCGSVTCRFCHCDSPCPDCDTV